MSDFVVPTPTVDSSTGFTIYGGSVGINRVVEYLALHNEDPMRFNWKTYLVNLDTLFRNTFDKKNFIEEIRNLTFDIELLITYIDQYNQVPDMKIIFYVPKYDDLKRIANAREHTGNNRERIDMFNKIIRSVMIKIPKSTLSGRQIEVVECMSLPCTFVPRYIRSKMPDVDMNAQAVMITHHPVDLHIREDFPNLYILESYTGVVKQVGQFGTKLAVKDERVPFNWTTHKLFGDPHDIKSVLKPKDKETLFERAIQKRWSMMSEGEIKADILKTPITMKPPSSKK